MNCTGIVIIAAIVVIIAIVLLNNNEHFSLPNAQDKVTIDSKLDYLILAVQQIAKKIPEVQTIVNYVKSRPIYSYEIRPPS